MLDIARKRCLESGEDWAERVEIVAGDAREVRLGRKFDAVLSMFHVISYMTDNESLDRAFRTAADHLDVGGIFLFDFWYGPAVLSEKPEKRSRQFRDGDTLITRSSEPQLIQTSNVVEVKYSVEAQDLSGGHTDLTEETHTMRYLFLPELAYFLEAAGFRCRAALDFMTDHEPRIDSWSALIVAEKS